MTYEFRALQYPPTSELPGVPVNLLVNLWSEVYIINKDFKIPTLDPLTVSHYHSFRSEQLTSRPNCLIKQFSRREFRIMHLKG